MADPGGRPEEDALRELEARLDRAAAAVERLLAQASDRVADPGPVPPAGWQRRAAPGGDDPLGGWLAREDAELLLSLLAGLRERIPPELQRRLVAALRELLLAVRALIDWCLQRAERRAAAPAEVQDIPIV